ncbi:uncharacterized protein PRCAT00002527001 [Priceomyces carsonii]|uniref:uncharacterized protein n=1 Tax=Priceomyces carsonii TaxID=28549 RepID=UPI002EDAE01A|nr:unnamed protein product [Priceomyces carsonii]
MCATLISFKGLSISSLFSIMADSLTYFAYEEPNPVTILIYSGFILLLNAIKFVLDRLISCGLVGQILIGVTFGVPGCKWLTLSAQKTIMQLGYIGLILMVYEGGLSTPFKTMKDNLLLSLGVAITGIITPIGLSFTLMSFSNASPVAAFAAGAALCSTSLGTALTVLSTANLKTTKLGVLLTNAAVIDDIAGLIMMQVVSNLGDGDFTAASVLRPVFVSLGLILIVLVFCYFALLPVTIRVIRFVSSHDGWFKSLSAEKAMFVVQTLTLIGLVIGATYGGASGLTAAYVTGAAITWWDSEILRLRNCPISSVSNINDAPPNVEENSEILRENTTGKWLTGHFIFNKFYAEVFNKILCPFFFASIGFSIPITQMFTGRLIWRGFVYALLMFFSKLICGLWVLAVGYFSKRRSTEAEKDMVHISSLYTAVLLGLSMVPRGEIGFLISSLAESKGVFSDAQANLSSKSSEIYIVVTWAIVLCTFLGPIMIGYVIRKVKKRTNELFDPLHKWGAGTNISLY